MKKEIRVAVYDPHNWYGEKKLRVESKKADIELTVHDISDRPPNRDLYLICDEYTGTNFPYFFPKKNRVALLKESPKHFVNLDIEMLARRFNHVVTHKKSFLQQYKNFVRVEYSANWVDRDPSYCAERNIEPYKKTKNVSFVGNVSRSHTEGYRYRKDVYEYLSARMDVDCFGKGIFPIEQKTSALLDYRFSIAMENEREDYYFSEKLIDCFLTDTVPIYYGCPSISEIFCAEGILSFQTIEELQIILDSLSEELYQSKLKAISENKRLAMNNRMDNFENYIARVVDSISEHVISNRNINLGTSKLSALCRLFGDLIHRSFWARGG